MSEAASAFTMRAKRLLARAEVRFAIAAVALLAAAVVLQYFASELQARSRRESSPFASGRAEGTEEETDWESIDLARRTFAMYLPQSRSLHYAWLGNDGLAADHVWIKSAGYVIREWKHRGTKFEWLGKLYGTVVELDPQWEGACRLGGTLLAAVGSDPSASLALLRRGMAARPDSWELPYVAGHICLMSPGRAVEAERFFRMADLRPGCPDSVERIIPRLKAEAGQLDLAIPYARKLAARFGAVRALLGELNSRRFERTLNDAVGVFQRIKGRKPEGLGDLRRARLMVQFDRFWAEEYVLYKEEHGRLMVLFRASEPSPSAGATEADRSRGEGRPGAPADLGPVSVVESGFLDAAVLGGVFPAPERADPLGKRYLFHAPTGTVRSEGLAEIDVARASAFLQVASNKFRREEGRWAQSLDELARYFAEWIARGGQLEQQMAELVKDGTSPEHPLAAWGERYTYDPEIGKVDATWKAKVPAAEITDDSSGGV